MGNQTLMCGNKAVRHPGDEQQREQLPSALSIHLTLSSLTRTHKDPVMFTVATFVLFTVFTLVASSTHAALLHLGKFWSCGDPILYWADSSHSFSVLPKL